MNILDRKWISVKDKLPTSSGKFEVTIKGYRRRYIDMCHFNSDSQFCPWGDQWTKPNVIAWRERDKPYDGD